MGFVQDRIEITEGEGAAVGIEFEPHYETSPAPSENVGGADAWIAEFRAVMEPGTASKGDLVVGGVSIGDSSQVLEAGTTWLAMRAPADGVAEGPETLRLRLEFLERWDRFHPYYPETIEVAAKELEVVIHDGDGAEVCSDILIVGAKPRRLTNVEKRCGLDVVYETHVTVESAAGRPLQLDRIDPKRRGRIHGWRVARLGSRVRHEFVMQWTIVEPWELRVEVCPRTGGGPTLVCTAEACETHAAGSEVPPPRRPAGCR